MAGKFKADATVGTGNYSGLFIRHTQFLIFLKRLHTLPLIGSGHQTMHLPFWLTTALLFPVLLYQGKQARRNTPRLPEAGGSPSGQYGKGTPGKRILVIGESMAGDPCAGVIISDPLVQVPVRHAIQTGT